MLICYPQVAGNHGRAVGKTIAGDPQPFVKVPIFWSARKFSCIEWCTLLNDMSSEGQQLRYCGLGAGYDDIIIHGNIGEMKVTHMGTLTIQYADLSQVHCLLCQWRSGRRCSWVGQTIQTLHVTL